MKASDEIRSIMAEKGITQRRFATMVGMKRQTNVSAALNSDMKISRFLLFADALGYEVILREKERDNRRDERKITFVPKSAKRQTDNGKEQRKK